MIFCRLRPHFARAAARFSPSLGKYEKSREEWGKIDGDGKGRQEIYLDPATVYWNYFQYDDALRTIEILRVKFADETLYAFEAGAVWESKHETTRAIGEYVKALGAKATKKIRKRKKRKKNGWRFSDKNTNEKSSAERERNYTNDCAAFETERRKAKDAAYVFRLRRLSRRNRAASESRNNFEPRGCAKPRRGIYGSGARFYASAQIASASEAPLKRLAKEAKARARPIAYRLQLAEIWRKTTNSRIQPKRFC